MPHLDEGHIHAMLDGELTAADREAAEQHPEPAPSASNCWPGAEPVRGSRPAG
jgi:anti-sigma factor RsiW